MEPLWKRDNEACPGDPEDCETEGEFLIGGHMSKILFYVFIGIGLFFLIFFLYYRAKISKINAELRRIQRSNYEF